MARYEEIRLAAWLHDMGKIAQRAGAEEYCSQDLEGYLGKLEKGNWYSHTHALYTEGFLQKVKDCFPQEVRPAEVIRLASGHHHPSTYDEWLIAQGDRLSSGSDRCKILSDTLEPPQEKGLFYEQPLVHLLSTLQLPEKPQPQKASSLLKPLEGTGGFPVSEGKVTREQYQQLLQDFEGDLQSLKGKGFEPFMEVLDTLFERYCWCVPSATNDDRDISLYQHAKTTAAFAGTLYRYHQETQQETNEALQQDAQKFLFINGDLSGIQNYIFDLKTSSDNARLLRSRSFQLWALGEIIGKKLTAHFKVSPEHLLISAGGKLLLLVPNTEAHRSLLPPLRLELESYFADEFAGKLVFILSEGVPASYTDVQKNTMPELLAQIRYQRERAKQRKMQTYLAEKGPALDAYYGALQKNGECECCGILPKKSSEPGETLCRNCSDLIDIGKDLVRASRISLTPVLGHFGQMVRITRLNSEGAVINDYTPGSPRMFLPYTAPWKNEDEGVLRTFEEIANLSTGHKKLALFKADLDNTGLLFTAGLGNRISFSRYAGLSRLLHYFFSGYYPDFVRRTEQYKEGIYTVFSGGDDLCILGPWDRILHFAADFRKELAQFTHHNPSVTISGGIALADPKLPVRRIAEKAEAALEEAKHRTLSDPQRVKKAVLVKDGVSVFGVTVSWQDYEQGLEDGEKIIAALKAETLSIQVVYKMLDLADRAKRSREGHHQVKDMLWMSSFRYMVSKNIEDKTVKGWFSDFGRPEHIEKSRIAVSYALYAQRDPQEE